MKFINYLEKVSGVDILGLTSFGIFFVFFIVMLTWVIKTDKSKIEEISRIPLDNQEQ
ncbi:MAG: CcoQ/FixQ family Cbb3-type cytochrome c oxidase assembly chaperone [Chitinophagaceae bacterium]|nr:CcoQ/FixQ family Cbb3-type cytochrome c oxidase assembly chaperone [Chitinophagaceae bacterium]